MAIAWANCPEELPCMRAASDFVSVPPLTSHELQILSRASG